VAAAVRGSDAVLSVLGVPFSKEPVDLFSTATRSVVEAMRVEGVKRLVVVSSSATYPHHHADAGVVFNRVLQPWVTRTIGRTVYDDMRRMEELVHASDLAWTVMRPSGLFDPVEPSTYELADEEAPGIFTARTDLAAALVEVVDHDRYVERNDA